MLSSLSFLFVVAADVYDNGDEDDYAIACAAADDGTHFMLILIIFGEHRKANLTRLKKRGCFIM